MDEELVPFDSKIEYYISKGGDAQEIESYIVDAATLHLEITQADIRKGYWLIVGTSSVMKLANQSLEATKVISELVQRIQRESKEAVKQIHRAKVVAQEGKAMTENAARKFEEITLRVDSIMPQLQETY